MTPPRKKPKPGPVPVDALKHDDARANIPTEELRDFVAGSETDPAKQLYPRDPSLDPQLVWKGKDGQDAEDLAVPTVPIYIQETVHPRIIIENLRDTAGPDEVEPELTLFDDLRSLEFEEMVDFYQHSAKWTNRMVLGDSLLIMNSLAEKEGLRGKVQTIYIDPPYGIKFGSNWQVSTRKRDVKDGKAEDATRQPEQIRAFRDTWELGIHSYLSYLRDRLVVSRELLTESGSCFVQIGDENVHLVRSLMDEVFGAENFISQITFRTSVGLGAETIDNVTAFILWYARDKSAVKYRQLWQETKPGKKGASRYRTAEFPDGSTKRLTDRELETLSDLPDGTRLYRDQGLTSRSGSSTTEFEVVFNGRTYTPSTGGWRTSESGMKRLVAANRLLQTGQTLSFKKYFDDFKAIGLTNFWEDVSGGITSRSDPKVYVVQTSTKVVERCLLMATDPGDLVLDPTCGAGTTALVAERWGRRWITADTSRVALALARTRLMSSRLPAYVLADSIEGRLQREKLGMPSESAVPPKEDPRKGFVYRQMPHVTLRSIATDPDIRDGMSQEEIDSAIERNADQEILYDQPYENKKAVRVAGPFTVESLSPHRMLDQKPDLVTEDEANKEGTAPFATTILENLQKAGVQNTVRNEHLDFESLEPVPGRFIHMRGQFVDKDGETRTVMISLGPEHGTVGADQVNEAAKEAMKGAGTDLLLVCAFSFDAHADEEAKEFAPDGESMVSSAWAVTSEERKLGKLPVMLVRMNPDLAMGDELLKKTGSGNLFMVFGEPDIVVDRVGDGELEIEIRGVDIYDPTTGTVRSNSTDEIACWLIDTNYNAESFYVRHAYFTGADKPYKRLARALKADINEDAWQSLYRTRSRAFPVPESGRIAVKVINHYGDEVLKAFDV